MIKKIICFLLGHDDPVFKLRKWLNWESTNRNCVRCGIKIKTK